MPSVKKSSDNSDERSSQMKSLVIQASFAILFLASTSAGLAPGGFVEKSYYPAQRPIPDLSFLPSTASVFTFPNPYNTKGYRLTLPTDPKSETNGYSYWPKINNHKGNDTMYIVVGELGTDIGTVLYSINKVTDEVKRLGSLFPLDNYAHYSNAGLMYWSLSVWNELYYFSSSKMYRYFVFENRTETVFDSTNFRPNTVLWQMHSSADGLVHSFTLKASDTYSDIACGVYIERNNTFRLFEEYAYEIDECQIDKSGRYLSIKQNDQNGKRLIQHVDLETGAVGSFSYANGAYGHSDHGYASVCGMGGFDPYAMSAFRYDFPLMVALGDQIHWENGTYAFRSEPYPNNYGGPDHYSWTNARDPARVPYEKQFVCGAYGKSTTGYSHDRELLCFRPDGSFDTLIVAPVMSYIPSESDPSFYDNAPKAVLDPTGDYIFWTANLNTDRLFAFVAQVPWHLLVSEQDYNPNGPFSVPTTPTTSSPSKQPSSKPSFSTGAVVSNSAALVLISSWVLLL